MSLPSAPVARAADHVSEARLVARLDSLARIGATPQGGVNRQALSLEDAQAQAQMVAWGRELGLEPSRDAVGNLFLRLPGEDPALAPVLSGSHLDSQPTGGRFDGVYGVVAALEAAQALRVAGFRPRRSFDVVAWMNEEGSRFAPGMMGSAVFAGARRLDETLGVCDAQGCSVAEALQQTSAQLADVPQRPLGGAVYAFVEAHIEQGPELERAGLPVGVVTGIQGKHTFRVEVLGEAAHAGTSRRAERKDALLSALAMVQALSQCCQDVEDRVRFTVGRFEVLPNAPSVVPARVVFSIDLRHPDTRVLSSLAVQVEPLCRAKAGPCGVRVSHLSAADSLVFPQAMQARLWDSARALGIPAMALPSAAGHDARYLHAVAPTAMVFVPCHLGITHNEAESAEPADLAAGTRVLVDTLQGLLA